MKPLLTKLENNEAVLLLYACDELPAADRAEVEQMLATSASMREDLRHLEESLEGTSAAISLSDAASATGQRGEGVAAVRNVSRLIRQWQVDRQREPATPLRRPGRSLHRWAISTSAAAAILVVFFVWWSKQPEVNGPVAPSPDQIVDNTVHGGAIDQPETPATQLQTNQAYVYSDPNESKLSQIERGMDALDALRDSGW